MFRTSRRATWLLLLGLMATVLAILPATSSPASAAAAKPKLLVFPASPVEGSRFTISGTTADRVRTKVVLQTRAGAKWKAVQTRRSDKRGRFIFSLTAKRPSRTAYRAVVGKIVLASRVVTSVAKPVAPPPVIGPPVPPASLPPEDSPLTPPAVPPLPVDPLPVTVPLTTATAGTLDDYDPASGVMTFGPDAPLSVRTAQPGTTIAVPVSSETPNGALRKVTAVSPGPDGTTVIETTDGVLAEAVAPITDQPQVVDFTHVSTSVSELADGVTVDPSPLIPGSMARAARRSTDGPKPLAGLPSIDGPMIGIKVANAKYDFGSGDVTFNGSIAVGPTADLHLDQQTNWDWANTTVRVKSYKFGSGASVDAKISAEMSSEIGSVKASKKFTLAQLHHVLTGFIGPLPVVVDLHQKMVMEVEANGSVGVRFETTMKGRAVGGIESRELYDTTPKPYSESPTVSSSLRLSGKTTVKAFLGAVFATNLYGGAGPEMKMGGQAEAEVEIGTPIDFTPVFEWDQLEVWDFVACRVTVGPHMEVELKVSDAIEDLVGTEVGISVFALPFPALFDYTCPDPSTDIATASLPDAQVGRPYDAAMRTADDREGLWDVSAGELPEGLSLGGGTGRITGTPLRAGSSAFTVRFTDAHNRAATRDYVITVQSPDYRWSAIAAGGDHSCGVATDGMGYCWGHNVSGKLGDGTVTDRAVPTPVASQLALASITAGWTQSCALTSEGQGYCWGGNPSGQLGDGTVVDRGTPTAIAGSHTWRSVSAGDSHTCGVTTTGAGYCWGNNDDGRLGDGTLTTRSIPTEVSGGHNWMSLTAGRWHTCGVTVDGAGYCWGSNVGGKLGDSTDGDRTTPTLISGDRTWTSVTAGAWHTCGVTAGGAGYCWGRNWGGRLGDGTEEDRAVATPIAGGHSWATLSAGQGHSCGVTTAGLGYCWGWDWAGVLGDGTQADEFRSAPHPVVGDQAFTSITTPGMHACGLATTGIGYCWGSNVYGQIGHDFNATQHLPGPVGPVGWGFAM